MKLKEQIAVRVDSNLKGMVLQEVKIRRARGLGADGADVVRDALIEYFERKKAALKQLTSESAFSTLSTLALVVLVFVAAGFLWVFRSIELVMALVAWVSVIKYRFMQADANLHRRLSRREIIVICIGLAVLGLSTTVWAAVEVWGMLL